MNPTILIFLKAPLLGTVKTRLAKDVGDEAALEIYRSLVQRQMAAIPPEWPVEIHFSPPTEEGLMRRWLGEQKEWTFWPQAEGGLGMRLNFAMSEAFSRGAHAVMLIGGDCPELRRAQFEQARDELQSHDVVMGPSLDGGYYLLASDQPRGELFENVAWSTAEVAPRTREIIAEQGWRHSELAELGDVDTLADWEKLRNRIETR
ncbi:MAG: TIGR04282 family arsenosugar biosynthesis glycosyltransferase [Synoicihabitans sp.]